jgi:antitoxin ParD1/3/4
MIFFTILWKTAFMGTTRKTITVTDQQDSWIKSQIAAGQFTNDSEYVRDLIRRDQASQADIEAIRAALIEGEESGEPQLFDSSQFKQELAAKHADKIR